MRLRSFALFESAAARTEEVRTWPFNREASAGAIARLKILLEVSDGEAEESFRRLQQALAGGIEKPYLDGLKRIDQRFRF